MTDADHVAAALAHLTQIRSEPTTQECLDVVQRLLNKFPRDYDAGAAANLMDCVSWLEDTLRKENKTSEQYRKPAPQIEPLRVLEPKQRLPQWAMVSL
jgi:hypothetical protein